MKDGSSHHTLLNPASLSCQLPVCYEIPVWNYMAAHLECDVIYCHIFCGLRVISLSVSPMCCGSDLGD